MLNTMMIAILNTTCGFEMNICVPSAIIVTPEGTNCWPPNDVMRMATNKKHLTASSLLLPSAFHDCSRALQNPRCAQIAKHDLPKNMDRNMSTQHPAYKTTSLLGGNERAVGEFLHDSLVFDAVHVHVQILGQHVNKVHQCKTNSLSESNPIMPRKSAINLTFCHLPTTHLPQPLLMQAKPQTMW